MESRNGRSAKCLHHWSWWQQAASTHGAARSIDTLACVASSHEDRHFDVTTGNRSPRHALPQGQSIKRVAPS